MMKIPRRRFLSDSVGGAATLAAVNQLAIRSTAASPNDAVVVAVIGAGGFGSTHVERLVKRQDARIAAICDVDQTRRERAGQMVHAGRGYTPKLVEDFRDLLNDKSINAFIIATPHHWHAPIAVRAMQAGKDVYVEKPASHVFREGRTMIEAARKYGRIFQHGTQMRSSEVLQKAEELLKSGIIGEIKMSKAWTCQKVRIEQPVPDGTSPPGVNYDLWLGPAPAREFNANRLHVYWRAYQAYGNGDIGDDGAHDLDIARWGLGVTTHPVRITAHGSRIDLKGEREFPDNMMVAYHYEEGKVLLYEERDWTPYGNQGFDSGNMVYGTDGYMIFSRRGHFQFYLGPKEERGPGIATSERRGHPEHLYNFLDCVRTRQQTVAPAEVAHLSCGLIHLGEVAYRVGRVLHFDPKGEQIVGDAEANALLTKKYRDPWKMPDPV